MTSLLIILFRISWILYQLRNLGCPLKRNSISPVWLRSRSMDTNSNIDPDVGRGGGAAVVVNKTLNCCRCPDFDAKSFESIELLMAALLILNV